MLSPNRTEPILFIYFFENIKPKQLQCLSLDQFSAPMHGSLNPRPVYCLSQIHFTARSKHSHYIIWDVLQGRVIYIFSRSGTFRNGLGCTVLRCIGVLPQVNATPMGLCSVSRQSVGLDWEDGGSTLLTLWLPLMWITSHYIMIQYV